MSDVMTLDEFLTDQEQLAAKATKGPWYCAEHSNDVRNVDKELICVPCFSDQPFIASARTSVPILLRIVRELTRFPDKDDDLYTPENSYRLRSNRQSAHRILKEARNV